MQPEPRARNDHIWSFHAIFITFNNIVTMYVLLHPVPSHASRAGTIVSFVSC